MRRSLPLVTALFLLSGCDLLAGLQNRKVLALSVLATPEVAPTQVPGFDAGFPAVSAGVTAQVYFAERRDDLSTTGNDPRPPVGLDQAAMTLRWQDAGGAAHTVTLRPTPEAGRYEASAQDGLAYVPGATYELRVRHAEEEYTASVVAPAAPRVAAFPAERWVAYPSYQQFDALTLEVERAADDLTFYAAQRAPASAGAPLDAPTCTNLPLARGAVDARQLLDLVLDGSDWRRSAYTLRKTSSDPAERCFPVGPSGGAPAGYVVTAGVGRRGSFSGNLFSGSVALAAALDGGAVVFLH
jgi:hypothetical protein